jgi:hypothetical protein
MKTALLLLAVLIGCFYLSWNLGIGENPPPGPTHYPSSPSDLAGGSAAIYREHSE